MKTETIHVGGMMCAACVRAVERAASKIDGVEAAAVNLASETLRVTYDGSSETLQKIKQAVIDQDYSVIEPDALPVEKTEPRLTETKRLIFSAIFASLLMCVGMGPMMGIRLPSWVDPNVNMKRWAFLQMVLALVVMALNVRVYRTGFKTLVKGVPGMDSLIAVSTAASFLYSVWGLIQMPSRMDMGHEMDLYFESCGTILTFVLLGKYLEGRAKRKTNDAVKKLKTLAPETAVILNGDKQLSVPLEAVLPDDLVLVKPGERVPVDGTVESGRSRIDESMLTGESVPNEKTMGDHVIGGSQNLDGSLVLKAEKTAATGVLSQMIAMVEEAQGTKAPIARLADKVAGVFVPTVMTIALVAALIWYLTGAGFAFALRIFVTVLVIACPCALGLATPTAIMVGTGAAAERGILFKDGQTLENLSFVKTVIFDKTGTITEGHPQVTEILPADTFTEVNLLRLAASAEQMSEHTLAQAVVNKAKERRLDLYPVTSFSADLGKGIHAEVDGHQVIIGSERQLEEAGIPFDLSKSEDRVGAGTVILIGIDGIYAGAFFLTDQIRPNSEEAINRLKMLQIHPVMLTGDRNETALRIAQKAGIDQVYSEILPDGKADIVHSLISKAAPVAMVGDGINDAPALAAADIGIAVASGTDIAVEAADIILMKNDLLDVIRGIQISDIVLRNIKQNLFWAFAFNSLGIPIAAGILYPFGGPLLNPMIAAAAMSCSSVFVVSNALRISKLVSKKM